MGCRPPRGPGRRRRILSSPGNQPIAPDMQESDLVVNFLTPLGSPGAQLMQQQRQVPDVRWNGPFVNLTGKPVLNTPCGWRALRISST